MIVHKKVRVKPQDSGRADRVVQELTGLSRADVRGLFDHGCIRVNGTLAANPGVKVNAGDSVELSYDKDRRYHPKPAVRSRSFRLVYEDDVLVVVDKQAGVLTVPTASHEQDTLVHEVARYFSKGPRIRRRAAIVHRLDRGTSGLLVFGKSEAVARQLKAQFEMRKPEREYVAIVAGKVEKDEGTFMSNLATAPDLDQYSTKRGGKPAVTHYQVERRLRGATLMRVFLQTGRRNQIRVHFSEAGHPVLGDDRYGTAKARHPLWKEKRLALHAAVLGFTHPVTGRPLRFTSPVPAGFHRFVKNAS